MSVRGGVLMGACGAVLVLGAAAAAAQSAPPGGPPAGMPPPERLKLLAPLPGAGAGSRPPSADPRDLAGVYTMERVQFRASNLPLSAKAMADRELDRQRTAAGKPTGGLAAICRPQPTFRLGSELFPGEIAQTAGQVVFLNEEHRTRLNVYLDRDHPADLKPSYFGDSVGRWEGDTLVIDTIGFNGRERTVSTRAHVVTRVRKLDGGRRLEVSSTTVDPEIYTAPVTETTVSVWNPDVQVLEFQCEENLEGAMEGLNVAR